MEAALGPASLFLRAGSMIAGGMSSASQARSMREQEKIQAEWGRIRADQTDASAREGLESDLSSYRATFNANDAGASVANLGILNQVREIRNRDRRISVGNANREAYGAEMAAAQYNPQMEIFSSVLSAGPSLLQGIGELY